VDDILSQGGDREPSPWPRRLAVIAALIVVAVIGVVVYRSFPRHQHAPAAIPRASVTASPAPVPTASATPSLPPEPDGIGGHTLAWDRSLRLPAAGTQPVWFSPATGDSSPIGGLPSDRSGYQFIRAVGGWAVQANPAVRAGCGSCAGQPAPVWFLADGARSVTRVGTASLVAPAATADAVWLTSYPLGANMSTAAGTAREVGVTGAPLGPQVRLPFGYMIDQATNDGLLLARVSQQPGVVLYKLWDPSAAQTSREFAGVIAASTSEIAWTTPCAPQCGVQILDLATGRHTSVKLPAGSSVASGAFSPDGGFLALQVSSSNNGDDGALAMQLDVAPVASGRLTAVPGTFVSSDALIGFGWPAGGDSLVAEFSFTTKTQLASWHPGASRLAVTVIQPGRNLDSLILG
jgi:hypothetical protein